MINHQITFDLYKCANLNEKKDVANAILELLSHDVILTASYREKSIKFSGNPDEYVNEHFNEVELTDNDKDSFQWKSHFIGDGLLETQQKILFHFELFHNGFNKVSGSLITSEEDVDLYSKIFLKIATTLYQVLKPSLGVVDYAFLQSGDMVEDVPAAKLGTLYWSTFFGLDYVNKYGKKYFEEAPVWRKEKLLDGGYLIQLSEYLKPPKDYVSLEEIKRYFERIGINTVSWPNVNLYNW